MEDVWETRQVQDEDGTLLAEHHRVPRDKGNSQLDLNGPDINLN